MRAVLVGVAVGLFLRWGLVWAKRRWPDGWLAREGLAPLLLGRRGAYGVPSRSDWSLRGMRLIFAGAVLFVLGFVAYDLSERAEPLSRMRLSLEAYSFVFFILGVVIPLAGVGDLYRGWRGQAARVVGDDRAVALDLAVFLEDHAAAWSSADVWPDFSAVEYAYPACEEVRREIVARFPYPQQPRMPEDAAKLRQWATRLREATA
jgi:hypothetical protein